MFAGALISRPEMVLILLNAMDQNVVFLKKRFENELY